MNCFAICWLWRNWYSLLTLTLRCVRLFQTIHPPHTLEFTRSGYVFDGILSEVAGVAEGEGGEELIISSFLFGRCWNIKSRWWVNTGKIRDSSHSTSLRVNSITSGEFSEWQNTHLFKSTKRNSYLNSSEHLCYNMISGILQFGWRNLFGICILELVFYSIISSSHFGKCLKTLNSNEITSSRCTSFIGISQRQGFLVPSPSMG